MNKDDVWPGLEVVVIRDYEIDEDRFFRKAWAETKGVIVQWPPPGPHPPNRQHSPAPSGCALVRFENGQMHIPLEHLDYANLLERIARL